MNPPTKEPLFDVRDGFFFGGLVLAGAGGVMLSLPWTLVALGTVLVLKASGPFGRGGA
jgi:hypothetical protein